MDQITPRHEKIRFRRHEIARLQHLPSAAGQEEHWNAARLPLGGRWLRWLAGAATIATSLVLLLGIGGYALATYGLNTDSVHGEAEAAIEAALGEDVDASFGPARISFDASRLIAVEVSDVSIREAGTGQELVQAGSLRLGLRVLPLFSGRIELGSIGLVDARIVARAGAGGGDWLAGLKDADGLVDPDRVSAGLFAATHALLDRLERTTSIGFSNVEIVLPDGGAARSVKIADASLGTVAPGELQLSGALAVDGRDVTLSAKARRNETSRRISDLDVTVGLAASDAANAAAAAEAPPPESLLGATEMRFTGAEGIGGEPARLALGLNADFVLRVNNRSHLAGSLSIAATQEEGTGRVNIERGRVLTGRSQVEFGGWFGKGEGKPGSAPVYRYEIASDRSLISSQDSGEAALPLAARAEGSYDAAAGHFAMDEFAIRTAGGALSGMADFTFAEGTSPAMNIAVQIPEMPIADVKQIWPFFTAHGARRWVMANLFGGVMKDSSLRLALAPGRATDNIPLNAQEVYGRARVEDTRFDVTGDIPPVREASGVIDFAGTDVDIAVSEGTVYLPSGGVVKATNGKLAIRDTTRQPLIGKLEMDVAGETEALAELASLEPIAALQRTGMASGDFSGDAAGHVSADIPLIGHVPTADLDYSVALDFRNLDLRQPVEGQKVTGASGKLTIDPQKAVVLASAKLNGAPAKLDLVEPLGDGKLKTRRGIEITVDDNARKLLAPGLGSVLAGPVKLAFDAAAADTQHIEADLTDAKVSLPWAGWSKGAGIAATLSFDLDKDGDTTKLSTFKLAGKSFSMTGDVTLRGGNLASAAFDRIGLNRGDDVALSIKRDGKGYAVSIRGKSLDARPIIKRYLSDAPAGEGEGGDDTPLKVSVDVDKVTGFNDKTLSNVKIDLAARGDTMTDAVATAVSGEGGAISIRQTLGGGNRALDMQSADAGSILGFLDIYSHMQGGVIQLALSGKGSNLKGQIDARDFVVVDEPKLASLVGTTPPGGDRSLNQAVDGRLDTAKVRFQRGYAVIEKRPDYLALERGILRGPSIGASFQGVMYDQKGNMDMTGTFMPAYGLNRIFGEIPLVGLILGNGRDKGLIGVTFRLAGDVKDPKLQVNPLSAIAPGIFRTIFEFR
ncbi:MAG: AsmA-like C-terminal domain-containing protein [Rhizobiaceae bacterium]